ncbi:hypothetical protein T08_7805 [Trichinella sp. T8]|nr:hypothetical protein T08_7805 [Trichinella sp. T8]
MANDERRWKLFVANRVKEIQAIPQLLETLYYERQCTRLGQQGLRVAHAPCEHRVVARNQLDINGILDQTEIERVGRTSFLSITTSLRRNMEDVIDPIRHSNFEKLQRFNTFCLYFIYYAQERSNNVAALISI